ncbi:hypothetical protein ACFLZM_00805 [Thermodesulfobacteriota bacterium]
MKKTEITVVVSLYEGGLEDVAIFRDYKKGRAYYDAKIGEVFGSEEGYQKSLEDGCPDQLFYLDQTDLM